MQALGISFVVEQRKNGTTSHQIDPRSQDISWFHCRNETEISVLD